MTGRILTFPRRPASPEEGRAMARRILAIPPGERLGAGLEDALEDPETLMSIVEDLRERVRRDPQSAFADAEFVWRFLRAPGREVGIFDETEYFRGETALLASIACRYLGRASDARSWQERADADFRLTVNAVADGTRVGFERLAWAMEEGRFSDVIDSGPLVAESFRRCGMAIEALRSRVLVEQARVLSGAGEGIAARVEALCAEAAALGDADAVLEAGSLLAAIHVASARSESDSVTGDRPRPDADSPLA